MEAILEYGGLVVVVLAGLFGVGRVLVDRMAAREKVDGWDKAKEVFDDIAPTVAKVKEWADPNSSSVPPSPSNPEGTA